MARLPLVSPVERALFLRAQPYLSRLTSPVLTALASYTEERVYRPGAQIRVEGQRVERILFLGSGVVEIGGPPHVASRPMQIEAPGAVGLAHHFAGRAAAPLVRATAESLCLEISVRDLDQILEDHFPMVHQVAITSCEQAVISIKALGRHRPDEEGFAGKEGCQETPASLDLVQRLAWAKRAPFFRETNLTLLASLTGAEPARHLRAGETLWKQGDPIDGMVLVLDGQLHAEGEFGSPAAGPGAVIGAWELMIPGVRFETWVADLPARVIRIPRDLFIDFLEDHFEFALSYLGAVSRKLTEAWDALSLLDERNAVHRFESPHGRAFESPHGRIFESPHGSA